MPIVNVMKEHELKNAYIGYARTPGANTLAYYPLNSTTTINDQSGNNHILTTDGTYSFGTYQGVDCFNSQGTGSLYCTSITASDVGSTFTVSCWVYTENFTSNGESGIVGIGKDAGGYAGWDLMETRYSGAGSEQYRWENLGSNISEVDIQQSFGSWYYLVGTYTAGSNNQKLYINGELKGQATNTMYIPSVGNLWIARRRRGSGNLEAIRKGGISKLIIEDKIWTAQEISDYYNLTKSDYGL